MRPRRLAVLACLLPLAVGVTVGRSPQSFGLSVSHMPAALYPGDAVLVVVRADHPMTAVSGEAFGRPIRFWSTTDASEWRGLVGVDVETVAGSYSLSVTGVGPQGWTSTASSPLPVKEKQFETRRLQVPPRFSDPPADQVDRIQREAALLATLFTQSSEARLWQGVFLRPVPGAATSSFGRLTVLNGRPGGRHRGADFRAAEGTPLVAPNAGRVVLAQDLYFTGNTVVVDHGAGLFSLFAHLSKLEVREGTLVSGGDRLGATGSTGRVTGPHLHWTVRLGEASVDPLALMALLRSHAE